MTPSECLIAATAVGIVAAIAGFVGPLDWQRLAVMAVSYVVLGAGKALIRWRWP